MQTVPENIYDISMNLEPHMLTYPQDPVFKKEAHSSLVKGDSANLSVFTMGSHAGTHIDYPSHFFQKGLTSSDLNLANVVGEALVLDVSNSGRAIDKDILESKIAKHPVSKILIKTSNSVKGLLLRKEFPKNYAFLTKSGAEFLVERKFKTIGVDFLSIEKGGSKNHPVHKHLLKNNVVIIEGLNLQNIKEGLYYLVCLPLKILDTDGTPVRAILIKNQ